MTQFLKTIYLQSLRDLDAQTLTRKKTGTLDPHCQYDVLALGKAATPMALGALDALETKVQRGFLITKESHLGDDGPKLKGFCLHEAAHPVPDEHGLWATEELIDWLQSHGGDERTLLVLLSGGTSSLLVKPRSPLTLNDLKAVNQGLLRSGLPIEVMNVLRKHISEVKGGQLGAICGSYHQIVQLVMVDISAPGLTNTELFSLVGSGPFSHDPSSIEEARDVLVGLERHLPTSVYQRALSALKETPKSDRCQSIVLASHDSLRQTAESLLGSHVLRTDDWESNISGEVKTVAQRLAQFVNSHQHDCGVYVACGEPTVELCENPGRGGRCQELALHFAREIRGVSGVKLLAGSSDGTDGPTEDAGAVVTGQTWSDLIEIFGQSNLEQMVKNNDCGTALAALPNALLKTGPTGQNLNDLFLLQIGIEKDR